VAWYGLVSGLGYFGGHLIQPCSVPFKDEVLSWPGFVEFDEINEQVITFCAKNQTYKIWELKNYNLLYTIGGSDVAEIKITTGLLMLVSHPTATHITFTLLEAENGRVIRQHQHRLQTRGSIQVVELFRHKIFLKQEATPLVIYDIYSGAKQVVNTPPFIIPSGYILMHEKHVFLTIHYNNHIAVWDLNGQHIRNLDDHQLWRTKLNNNAILVIPRQGIIISLCSSGGFFDEGTINISDVTSGKCLAKIGCADDPQQERERARALSNITALHFNDARNELYTGTKAGLVHIWRN